MGEKKEEEKKPEGGGGGENAAVATAAAAGPTPVVLKVDMHCEGCALKIKRAAKGFPGVEAVSTDKANNKLTVVGNADPLKIREWLESKTRKKVDLISPVPKKAPAPKESEPKKGQTGPKEQKKPTAPVSTTVVLRIRLHCDGCIQRIRKTISRYKGVDCVMTDSLKDLVTVMGTMDVNSLVPYLKNKLKRSVEIVPTKKDGGGDGEKKDKAGVGGQKKDNADGNGKKKEKIDKDDEKKDENDKKKENNDSGGDGEKKKDENGQKKKKDENDENGKKKENGGEGEKKKNGQKKENGGKGEKMKNDEKKENGGNGEKKKNGGNDEKKKNGKGGNKKKEDGSSETKKEGGSDEKQAPTVAIEANKMEYYGPYGYGGIDNGYHIDMVHAPQMFSDENPNACSIM